MERSRRRGRIGLTCRFELGARVSDGTRGGVSSDSGGGSSDAQRYCRQLRPRWGAAALASSWGVEFNGGGIGWRSSIPWLCCVVRSDSATPCGRLE